MNVAFTNPLKQSFRYFTVVLSYCKNAKNPVILLQVLSSTARRASEASKFWDEFKQRKQESRGRGIHAEEKLTRKV